MSTVSRKYWALKVPFDFASTSNNSFPTKTNTIQRHRNSKQQGQEWYMDGTLFSVQFQAFFSSSYISNRMERRFWVEY